MQRTYKIILVINKLQTTIPTKLHPHAEEEILNLTPPTLAPQEEEEVAPYPLEEEVAPNPLEEEEEEAAEKVKKIRTLSSLIRNSLTFFSGIARELNLKKQK